MQGRVCYNRIMDDALWAQMKHVVTVTKPIIYMLRIADSKKPSIGKVYEGIDKMVERIKELEADPDKKEELRVLCQKRWDQYHSPMHAAAFVLDPEFQGTGQERDKEVSDGWDLILTRLVPDAVVRRAVRSQISLYKNKA